MLSSHGSTPQAGGGEREDFLERFTFSSTLGSSVVDYAITDMDPSTISAFTVRQQSLLSDHNQINVFQIEKAIQTLEI